MDKTARAKRLENFVVVHHSVLEQIWIKRSYPDQRLWQHGSLYPISLESARIEIPHIGFYYIDFPKTDFYYYKNSFTVITFKLILLSKKVPNVQDFNPCWYHTYGV